MDANSLKLQDNLLVYQIQIRDPKQGDVYNHLRNFFEFRSVPFCVVTNKKLELIDSFTGFKPETFTSFIYKHFK